MSEAEAPAKEFIAEMRKTDAESVAKAQEALEFEVSIQRQAEEMEAARLQKQKKDSRP